MKNDSNNLDARVARTRFLVWFQAIGWPGVMAILFGLACVIAFVVSAIVIGFDERPSPRLERHIHGTLISGAMKELETRRTFYAVAKLDDGQTVTVKLPQQIAYRPGARVRIGLYAEGEATSARRWFQFDGYEASGQQAR